MTFDCNPQIIFFVTFSQFKLLRFLAQLLPKYIDAGYLYLVNLVSFGSTSTEAYRHWVSYKHNSSYSFTSFLNATLQVFLSRSEDVHVIWM